MFKRHEQVTSTFSKIRNEDLDESIEDRIFCGSKWGLKRFVGTAKNLYEYIIEDNDWVQLQCYTEYIGGKIGEWNARGCVINDAVYLIIRGQLKGRVDLLRLKSLGSSNRPSIDVSNNGTTRK